MKKSRSEPLRYFNLQGDAEGVKESAFRAVAQFPEGRLDGQFVSAMAWLSSVVDLAAMEVVAHRHGTFCFAELNTPDMEGGKRFYSELLGWTGFDVPSAAGGYSLMRLRGKGVAGLHRTAQGPQSWLQYISVESAGRTAARAQELGGMVRAAPFEVPDVGRMAVLEDPAGGVVALWEAKGHTGAGLVEEPGTMWWNELLVHDAAAAWRFYCELFRWSTSETRVPNGSYTIFKLGDQSVAGQMTIGRDWGRVTPHWQVFFAVRDCDASIAQAKALGGSLVFGPQDVPNAGRFAVLSDSGNATFAIMRPMKLDD